MLALNSSMFRNVPNSSLTGRADLHCLLTFSPTSCVSAHSALSGSSWADTPSYRNVLYPRGAVQQLETMVIALDRRLVRLCRHLSKNINARPSGREIFRDDFRAVRQQTAVFLPTHIIPHIDGLKHLTLPALRRTG